MTTPTRGTPEEAPDVTDEHGAEVADTGQGVDRPRDWDAAVAVAYLRMIGHTQQEAANGAGCGVRTLRRWEASDWWGDACSEARSRWMVNLIQESRSTIFKAIRGGDANKALEILERMDPEFVPPPQELRVGIMGLIAQLPGAEVSRIMALPEEERQDELLRLVSGGER